MKGRPRFLIDALNNSICFTYRYLRFSPKGLGILVDVLPITKYLLLEIYFGTASISDGS